MSYEIQPLLRGTKKDPSIRKYNKAAGKSPFGVFPKGYELAKSETTNNNNNNNTTDNDPTDLDNPMASISHPRYPYSCGKNGLGGVSSSLRSGQINNISTKNDAFSMNNNTEINVSSPPSAGAFKRRMIPFTEFRRYYTRGDLPLSIHHGSRLSIDWKVQIEKLDYHHYLPIFFDGIRETESPYLFLARQGCLDLLQHGGPKILPTIPQLIIPIKKALHTRHPDILSATLRILQQLVLSGDLIGEALVPYYRQILPMLNLFKNKHKKKKSVDEIDFGQRKREDVGDLVNETLQLLELHGGEDAYINIKYMVPSYESCIYNN